MEALEEATSGAIGGLLSTTILYPLDTCKTKYQAEASSGNRRKYKNFADVFSEAWREKRLLSLYQGVHTKNLQSVIAQFIYFYSYGWIRRHYLVRSGSSKMGTVANLLVAAAAGTCTAVLTQPLDTAATRMQTSGTGSSRSFWELLFGGTLAEAYDGLGASLILVSNPAIQYTVFEQLKDRMLSRKKRNAEAPRKDQDAMPPAVLSAAAAFALGALSKTVATVVTYPAIRCKVMLQAERLPRRAPTATTESESRSEELSEEEPQSHEAEGQHPRNMLQALRIIWHREGSGGFYKGLQVQILKTVLSSALMLMVKEKVSHLTWALFAMLRRAGKRQLGRVTAPQIVPSKVKLEDAPPLAKVLPGHAMIVSSIQHLRPIVDVPIVYTHNRASVVAVVAPQ